MMQRENKRAFAVLFVDDEEKAQKYFRLAYATDFPVLTAGSVPDALEILEKHGDEIAVLITDQRMPGQLGVDLLTRARADWPAIVRILTTAYSDLDDAIAAVNRGEIIRYITKPWDIEALRVDLRHAMDFFLLRRERDLLMAEKLSVRQCMAHSDRLRCLLVVAGGLVRLRHAPHAVAAWARDTLDYPPAVQPAAADLELWSLEARDTLDLTNVHRDLRSLDDSVESGFTDRADPAALLRGAGLAVEGEAGEVAIRRNLIAPMVDSLAKLLGDPASARLEDSSSMAGNPALRIHITGSASLSNPLMGVLASDGPDTELLQAYLIAWHHGGALTAALAEGSIRVVLTLPNDPDAVILPKPDEGWLADQFSMLEDWE